MSLFKRWKVRLGVMMSALVLAAAPFLIAHTQGQKASGLSSYRNADLGIELVPPAFGLSPADKTTWVAEFENYHDSGGGVSLKVGIARETFDKFKDHSEQNNRLLMIKTLSSKDRIIGTHAAVERVERLNVPKQPMIIISLNIDCSDHVIVIAGWLPESQRSEFESVIEKSIESIVVDK